MMNLLYYQLSKVMALMMLVTTVMPMMAVANACNAPTLGSPLEAIKRREIFGQIFKK